MRLSTKLGAIGWLLAAMMLALLSGCASAGSSNSTSSSTPAAGDSTAPASSESLSTTTAASRRASPGPLQTVERYWRAIASHKFEAAYRDLTAGSNSQSEATFVSAEHQSQIQSANFSGSVTAASGTAATITVDSLTTTDGLYGCRTWSGSYQLIRVGGRWQIARASISPSPCQDTGTTGNTGNTGYTGNTGITGNTGNTGNTGSGGCSPMTDAGGCYEPGEYCRDTDHGISGVAGDGESITCEDNNGWRWEPS